MSTSPPRPCRWCRRELPTTDPRARYCSKACRQTAWRLRRAAALGDAAAVPGRFAYADPPYPGLSKRYYGREASYAGEVDHAALVASLVAGGYTGWALSTSGKALRDVLPLCPEGAYPCPWVKPTGKSSKTRGIHRDTEYVIIVGGRQREPGVRDWLRAQPARGGGELMGRKPMAFAAWLFDLLGMAPGDELVDVFPGTGIIGRAWADLSSEYSSDAASSPSPGDGPVGGSSARRFLSPEASDDAAE